MLLKPSQIFGIRFSSSCQIEELYRFYLNTITLSVQFYGRRDVRVVDVPKLVAKPDQALISIEWCGICGSGLHEYLFRPGPSLALFLNSCYIVIRADR